ncbi:TetR family transcriptional regulator [Paenibacillus sp. OV219]|uniref:acyl-CoA-like ligand-binding transcription factor n=1 Tax=Paenibacillus sp. OV219 TaxID=1884377 RepID=UPI0008CE63CB|nr:TetR family transcriptional regulator [Paenibacillus sp. OV219]SEO88941.1 transcriptional regulator, TetR family [Paenibacillus sp. OV219]
MSPGDLKPVKIGLREKKKKKTRLTLQQHALRLFKEQGYQATTIEQIAEASEISPSTFFRYFATKEALVLEDDYDPVLIRAFQRQSPELTPIQAFRAAIREGFDEISEEEKAALQERIRLTMSVPELRAASLLHTNDTLMIFTEILSERLGIPKQDFKIMTLSGSILGAVMAVQQYCLDNEDAYFITKVDEALAMLEEGLSLE